MEELYRSLISGPDLLLEQICGELFGMTESEGPVLILVDNDQKYRTNHPGRVGFLHDNPELLVMICDRIDDGYDPCVHAVDNGCLIGIQLADCGYFMLFLPNYSTDIIQANMDLIELVLLQTQLICELIEKNNRLHHSHLSNMSRSSTVLSGR